MRLAYVYMQIEEYSEAEAICKEILLQDESDDMVHAMLANALHKQKDNDNAEKHHKKAIDIDPEYAPHHFNYANTLYDIKRNDEALSSYKKAFELDNSLDIAKEMIEKLDSNHE